MKRLDTERCGFASVELCRRFIPKRVTANGGFCSLIPQSAAARLERCPHPSVWLGGPQLDGSIAPIAVVCAIKAEPPSSI